MSAHISLNVRQLHKFRNKRFGPQITLAVIPREQYFGKDKVKPTPLPELTNWVSDLLSTATDSNLLLGKAILPPFL